MSAIAKFNQRAKAVNSLLCVGLDSDYKRLPQRFRNYEYPQFIFNRWIIEQTHPYVSAYKPNIAFYEARGPRGLTALRMTMEYLQANHPDILTICDAKRADIGSTSEAYAESVFDNYGFDTVTLNPYMGRQALAPFLSRADKGSIILCRTSDSGSGELQDLRVEGVPLWQVVAKKVAEEWDEHGNCMLVMGGTYPAEMQQVRALVGEMPFLVPGLGAQGGNTEAVLAAGLTEDKLGLIVNSSRSIIFAEDPAEAAAQFNAEINAYR